MIRCDITANELQRRVDAERPGWQARATARTEGFRMRGSYDDSESPIWSEIKQVFIDLQERENAPSANESLEAKKEYDLEHFRPKGSVKPWKVPPELVCAGVRVNQTMAKEPGYHLLPYHVLNYSVACAKCNSELKKDHFPIKGTRDPGRIPQPCRAVKAHGSSSPSGSWMMIQRGSSLFRDSLRRLLGRAGSFNHQRALLTIAFFKLDESKQAARTLSWKG